MKRFILPLILTAAFNPIAHAEQANESNWFIGAAIGQSDTDVSGYDEGTGFKFLGGYNLNKYFDISLEYVDLGELDIDLPGVGGGVEVDGLNLSVTGAFPVTDTFELFAKLGAFRWDADADVSFLGSPLLSDSDDGTDVSWGVGARVFTTETFGITAEYQLFDIDGDDIDLISLGVVFQF